MNFNIFFPSSRNSSGQKFYSLTWQTMHYFRHNPWTSSKINGTSILGMRGARNLLLPTGLAPLMQISQRGQIFPEVTFLFLNINVNYMRNMQKSQSYRSINWFYSPYHNLWSILIFVYVPVISRDICQNLILSYASTFKTEGYKTSQTQMSPYE